MRNRSSWVLHFDRAILMGYKDTGTVIASHPQKPFEGGTVTHERGSFEFRSHRALVVFRLAWQYTEEGSTHVVQKAQRYISSRPQITRIELKGDEQYFADAWKRVVEATQELYGADAVDAALKAFEQERTSN